MSTTQERARLGHPAGESLHWLRSPPDTNCHHLVMRAVAARSGLFMWWSARIQPQIMGGAPQRPLKWASRRGIRSLSTTRVLVSDGVNGEDSSRVRGH